MEKLFIKTMFILSIVAAAWLLFIFCKKTYLLIKTNKKVLKCSILQPDTKGILHNFMLILGLLFLNIGIYHSNNYYLSYDIYGKYFNILLTFSVPIFCFLSLAILNEFFPTIVTAEYICWMCQKVYQKEDVTYYYDKDNIYLYCDTKKLNINRKTKYDLLIEILEANYKRQEEKLH